MADLLEEEPLYQLRNVSDERLPRLLRSLKGVFDVCAQIFDLMQEGMEPFSYRGCQVRYIVADPHPWNVILNASGHVRLIDLDSTRCCSRCPPSAPPSALPAGCRAPCPPRWPAHYRREAGRVLVLALVALLLRWRGEVTHFESHCAYSEACWGLVGSWSMPQVEEALAPPFFSDQRIRNVVQGLLSHLRAAYFQDWASLPNASGALVDAFLAVRDDHGAWPPRILSFLQEARMVLS